MASVLLSALVTASVMAGCSNPLSSIALPNPFAQATPTPAAPSGSLAGLLPTPTPDANAKPSGTLVRVLSNDPDNLNPVLSTNRSAAIVESLLFPVLIGRSPYTGQFSSDGGMAERWDVSPDGRTYTFYLRPNVQWSDGKPVTAADFKFTYDAIASEQVESPYRTTLANLESITVLDPQRVQVVFKQARCDGLGILRVGWLPSHMYDPTFDDMMTSSLNNNPVVSAGPFVLQSWAPGEAIAMRRNARYWQGAPRLERLTFNIIADPTERANALLNGELDVTPLEAEQLTSVQTNPNLSVFRTNEDGYDFIALNLANPENPQPGVDDAGNRIVQDPHPVLADGAVRQAIARAIDYKTVIETIYLGRGYPLTTNVLPVIPWAHDASLEPYAYDPAAARQLLEDAGWTDSNADGIRERDTKPMVLELLVAENNNIHKEIAKLVQDQLNSVGFDITVTQVDPTTLATRLLGQTYDMAVTGWTGLGADPNDDWLWSSRHDRPGSDFNFVSYQNAEVDQLLEQANTLPGCSPEERAPLYKQIQRQIHDDLPYIFISGAVSDIGYSKRLEGVQPAAWDFFWNIQQWSKTPVQ